MSEKIAYLCGSFFRIMPFNSKRNSRDDNSRKSRSSSDGFRNNKKDDKSSFDSSRSYKSDKFNRDSNSDKSRFDKDSKFGRDSKFNKDSKFARDSKFNKDGRPDRDSKFERDNKFNKDSRPDRDSKFGRDAKFDRSSKFGADARPDRDVRPDRDSKFNREERPERKSRYGDEATPKRGSKFGKDSKFNRDGKFEKTFNSDRPYKKFDGKGKDFGNKRFSRDNDERSDRDFRKDNFRKPKQEKNFNAEDDGLIRLNRYISNSGICSRRKADELIEAGVISVNGVVVTELGTKVDPAKDEIRYNDERLKREKMVYVLLNKPKDYITTTDDPQERKTVMQLVSKATKERIYPVGRLDRNTTGLLLLTNDGNLAEKLSHPRNNISKIYNVELSRSLSQGDFNKIEFGIELEDGFIKPDDLSFVVGGSKKEVGIQIHSGKNRVVRRIFESLGYEVEKLDRVVYANLTKKDLPRGRWRYLEEKEIIQLKHLMK
ncbi:pseudouridine synthase [Sphingobacterium mizutaii]|uniref:pseudouridine synthase n=1 Tax=Sphingobacterium mizutaii TaxID=1010 RepID=UPI00397CB14B